MTAIPIVRLDTGKGLEVAVAELLGTTEYPQIARWIQFPTAVVLFLVAPKDPESGAIYVYDRRDGVWYWVDFENQKYSEYNLADIDVLLEHCCFLRLVENPRLLTSRKKQQSSSSRSEEHTAELQSPCNIVCRPLP